MTILRSPNARESPLQRPPAVDRGVNGLERPVVEEFGVRDRAVAERPQHTERVAEDQVRLRTRRGIQRGVAERDRARLSAESAPYAPDGQSDCDQQRRQMDQRVGRVRPDPRRSDPDAAVGPDEGGDQSGGKQRDVPVFGERFQQYGSGIVVVTEVGEFVRGEPFFRVVVIDAVRDVDDQREGVGDGKKPEQHRAVPPPFAQPQRYERQHDEQRVDVQDRHRVEHQAAV